ncbi:hypothetical protein NC651_015500 [Populus alba x Populus x berolinensis]|nr:hypothetical protein NC651_015500 [Populus alba x Populus x berolinensis]
MCHRYGSNLKRKIEREREREREGNRTEKQPPLCKSFIQSSNKPFTSLPFKHQIPDEVEEYHSFVSQLTRVGIRVENKLFKFRFTNAAQKSNVCSHT